MCFKSLVESKSKIPRIINKIANAINLFRFVFFHLYYETRNKMYVLGGIEMWHWTKMGWRQNFGILVCGKLVRNIFLLDKE